MNAARSCLLMGLLAALLSPGIAASADVGKGSQIYNMHCIGCHGIDGQSPLPNVPSFNSGERMMQPDLMLMQSIKTGKGIMPSFFGILTDQQIRDVIAFLRTLRR